MGPMEVWGFGVRRSYRVLVEQSEVRKGFPDCERLQSVQDLRHGIESIVARKDGV